MKGKITSAYMNHEGGTKYWRITKITLKYDDESVSHFVVKDSGKIGAKKPRVDIYTLTSSENLNHFFDREFTSKSKRGYDLVGNLHATRLADLTCIEAGLTTHFGDRDCPKAIHIANRFTDSNKFKIESHSKIFTAKSVTEALRNGSDSESKMQSFEERYSNIKGVGDFA